MKKTAILFACLAILVSCNSETKNKNEEQSTETTTNSVTNLQEEANIILKDITTDEALIATALMAAPKESRANATVIGYNMAGDFVTLKEGSNAAQVNKLLIDQGIIISHLFTVHQSLEKQFLAILNESA